jgi:hypothetical protein
MAGLKTEDPGVPVLMRPAKHFHALLMLRCEKHVRIIAGIRHGIGFVGHFPGIESFRNRVTAVLYFDLELLSDMKIEGPVLNPGGRTPFRAVRIGEQGVMQEKEALIAFAEFLERRAYLIPERRSADFHVHVVEKQHIEFLVLHVEVDGPVVDNLLIIVDARQRTHELVPADNVERMKTFDHTCFDGVCHGGNSFVFMVALRPVCRFYQMAAPLIQTGSARAAGDNPGAFHVKTLPPRTSIPGLNLLCCQQVEIRPWKRDAEGVVPMKKYMIRRALAVLLLSSGMACATPWLFPGEYGDLHVVVSPIASVSEKQAAAEFETYWEACTQTDISRSGEWRNGRVNVWIGRAENPWIHYADLEGLGDDGYAVRSIDLRHRPRIQGLQMRRARIPMRYRHLVIAGGEKRGTLYGVYDFFRKYMGVRWLTPDCTHIPDPPADGLPEIEDRYVPDIPWRDTNYWIFTRHPEFAAVHHINGNSVSAIPESRGGFEGYAGGFGHTFFSLVNPETYFGEHPEYFSEVNGKRMKNSQLCMTNPEVADIATESVRKLLREAPPNRRVVSVTQMDWPFWCECASCKALTEKEKSLSGPLIHFVNRIAENIEDEFPEAFIDTFAYTWSRKAPAHVKPRDNVIVRLCSIECDFSVPLTSRKSALNRAFRRDIRQWERITENLFIWDYTQNWYAFQGPHPNYFVLQPNIRFYRDHGVYGLFEQAAHSPGADFEYLKAWIIARSLWNPDLDGRALYDEFMDLYYREAAPFLREYHQLLLDKVHETDYELTIFSKMEWMDAAMAEKARAIFDRAFNAVQEKKIRARLERAYLPVQYAALVCPPDIEIAEDRYILRRPESLELNEYRALLKEYEVTRLEDRPIEALSERLNGKTPPRYREILIEKLENDRYEIWVVPELAGSIVRFHGKTRNAELFQGWKNPLSGHGTLQEWHLMNPEDPVEEGKVADAWEVEGRDENSITLRTALENGLELSRRMTLAPDADALEIRLEIRNRSEEERIPRVKIHPEFWTRGREPDLWLRTAGAWEKQRRNFVEEDADIAVNRIAPEKTDAWAFRIPREKTALINTFDSGETGELIMFFNRHDEHINLEIVPDLEAMLPGETRVLTARYAIRTGKASKPRRWETAPADNGG